LSASDQKQKQQQQLDVVTANLQHLTQQDLALIAR